MTVFFHNDETRERASLLLAPGNELVVDPAIHAASGSMTGRIFDAAIK